MSPRITSIIFFFAAIFLAAASRLFFLQVVKHQTYFDLAERQQRFARAQEPKRGDIFFKTKDGELQKAASIKVGATLYLNTKLLQNQEELFGKINQITPLDRTLFDQIAKKTNDPYEILKKQLSQEEAERVLALDFPGVGLEEERWRFYPAGSSASHLLGFVSSASGEPAGQYGVEKYYNGVLGGEDIVLTVEPVLQRAVEEELKKLIWKWSARAGGIIIVEPKTGAVRALAALPNFNPNEYQKEKNLGVFLNPFTEKIFELGSVFKPLTMASALDHGAVTPDTTYVDKGEVRIADRVIKNFDGKAHGVRTMTEVLEESLNTGAVYAMQRLGGEKLKEYFHRFGLGTQTGIDLPGELKGDLSNLDSGKEIEFATASFGQGVAVTPLQLTMALSALANGGKLMRPFLKEGALPQITREVIKPETSEKITKMLVDVVDMSLAGGQAKFPHMSIAAKTGTAQIPNSGSKGYSDEFLHSFFGYFPAYDTKFLIFIFLERPQGVKYASQSIIGTFKSLVEFLINYYTILPDR